MNEEDSYFYGYLIEKLYNDPILQGEIESYYADSFLEVQNKEELYLTTANEIDYFTKGLMEYCDSDIIIDIKEAYFDREFDKLFELVFDIWKNAYITYTLYLEEFPSVLRRTFQIPLRDTVGDLLLSSLATLRIEGKQYARIQVMNKQFIMDIEKKDKDKVFASGIGLTQLLSTDDVYLVYDYVDSYVFRLKRGEIVRNTEYHDIIIKDVVGYGIWEDNRNDFYEYIKDNEAKSLYNSEQYIRDVMPFNLYDDQAEDLINNFDEYYEEMTKSYYNKNKIKLKA